MTTINMQFGFQLLCKGPDYFEAKRLQFADIETGR